MFGRIRRYFCRHDFHLLNSYEKDVDSGVGYDVREVFMIYCPKCREQKEVLEHEYKATMKKQEVDRSHARE
jgi:hypothetical protein